MRIGILLGIFGIILILKFSEGGKQHSSFKKPLYRRFDNVMTPLAPKRRMSLTGVHSSSPGIQKLMSRRSPNYMDFPSMQDASLQYILSPFGDLNSQPPPPQSPLMSLDDAFKMGYQAGKSVAFGESNRNQRPMCGSGSGNRESKCFSSIYNFFFPPQPIYDDEDGGMIIDDYQIQPMDPNIFGVDQNGMLIPVGENDVPLTYDSGINQGGFLDGGILLYPPTPEESFVTGNQFFVDTDGNITPAIIDTSPNTLIPVGSLDSSPSVSASGDVMVPALS